MNANGFLQPVMGPFQLEESEIYIEGMNRRICVDESSFGSRND